MDKHTYSDIYDAGGKELVAFAKLFEHKKSCEVCMLEKKIQFLIVLKQKFFYMLGKLLNLNH